LVGQKYWKQKWAASFSEGFSAVAARFAGPPAAGHRTRPPLVFADDDSHAAYSRRPPTPTPGTSHNRTRQNHVLSGPIRLSRPLKVKKAITRPSSATR
jgi:hypothetical protein